MGSMEGRLARPPAAGVLSMSDDLLLVFLWDALA